jgi:hypothetical protein
MSETVVADVAGAGRVSSAARADPHAQARASRAMAFFMGPELDHGWADDQGFA